MNGHRSAAGNEEPDSEVRRLREELEATKNEIQRLSELRSSLEAEQRTALRDAVIRTRESIQEMEQEHDAALRRLHEETEAAIVRLRSTSGGGGS